MEPISKEELAWLAGIIDGEGCLQVNKAVGEDTKPGARICIDISSTTPIMIQRVSVIYKKLGLVFCYAFGRNKANNQFLRIMVAGQGSLEKLLQAVRPYLCNKLPQANLILEYITWRRMMPMHHMDPEDKLKVIGAVEVLYEKLKALHRERFNLQRLPRRAQEVLDLSNLEAMV